MRTGFLVGIALATVAVSWAWHRNPQGSDQRGQPSDGATAALIDPAGFPAPGQSLLPVESPGPAAEPLPAGDTTGLLLESVMLDDLLIEANGDSAEGFTPIDRERLAEQLRSDPELRKVVGD